MNFKYVCNRDLKNKLFSAHFQISSLEKPKVRESLREYNIVVMIIYSEKLFIIHLEKMYLEVPMSHHLLIDTLLLSCPTSISPIIFIILITEWSIIFPQISTYSECSLKQNRNMPINYFPEESVFLGVIYYICV